MIHSQFEPLPPKVPEIISDPCQVLLPEVESWLKNHPDINITRCYAVAPKQGGMQSEISFEFKLENRNIDFVGCLFRQPDNQFTLCLVELPSGAMHTFKSLPQLDVAKSFLERLLQNARGGVN